ncbi:MAG: hypothetical protein KJ970_03915 [Candidatus Eisenbacteria bacterium]|uniref:YjbH domain-containing protein n=1 Tax=Eiseniibacteriota bacterium TaxID=2212470 RepID=A0A948RXH7_UNCEI|nr:hypothetical protein [Candidatus Eisenbacteria bacterium]MBU1951020.1 hypothetical protein [Candidatus Eisenbacteria bacterium]MBU2690049.1 hypothetical protein [Candidatus Eisenbacteria bacterium]
MRIVWIAGLILLCATSYTYAATSIWPVPADGDLNHLAYADGPAPGELFLRYQYDQEKSSAPTFVTNRFSALYGVTHWLAVGASFPFHEQLLGELHKQGPGDTSIQARLHTWLSEDSEIRGSLRFALSLPTGFDEEKPPLAEFTSRTHDLLAEGSLQWKSSLVSVMLSPGLWMPGGDKSMALTGGAGVDWYDGLPFGFALRGEYFSQYNLTDKDFQSEVFGGIRHSLFWGFGLEFGVNRELLSGIEAPTTMSFRFSKGRQTLVRGFVPYRPADRFMTVILESPAQEGTGKDPNGFLDMVKDRLLAQLSQTPEFRVRSAADAAALGSGEPVVTVSTNLVGISEGNDRGLSIPHILSSPRATINVTMRLIVKDGIYGSTLHETLLHSKIRRGMGMELLPIGSDEDRMVPPPEVRRALMEEAARRIAIDVETELLGVLAVVEGT